MARPARWPAPDNRQGTPDRPPMSLLEPEGEASAVDLENEIHGSDLSPARWVERETREFPDHTPAFLIVGATVISRELVQRMKPGRDHA